MVKEQEKSIQTTNRFILAGEVCLQMGVSKREALELIETLFMTMSNGLLVDGEVKIPNFGSFIVRQKKERIGRNPKTKQEVVIAPRKVISMKYSSLLKKSL